MHEASFKRINDIHGHQVGDKAIIAFAKLIKDTLRTTDIAGRYGGDEFIIILPNTDLENANTLVSRLETSLNELNKELDFKLTVSGGICQYNGENSTDLIHKTDQRLYIAKSSGKSQFIGDVTA